MFKQAANCYKMSNNYDSAARCLEKCINCEESDRDKAEHYKELARLFKESDTDKYVQFTQKAIDLSVMAGRSGVTAQLSKECA